MSAGIASYWITVTTGNVFGAGTDARVFISLQREGNQGPEVELAEPIGGSPFPFSTNNNDEFRLSNYPNLGPLSNVKIRHDNSGTGIGNSWFLANIKVLDEDTNMEYSFPCDKWLSKNKGEKKLERVLDVSKVEKRVAPAGLPQVPNGGLKYSSQPIGFINDTGSPSVSGSGFGIGSSSGSSSGSGSRLSAGGMEDWIEKQMGIGPVLPHDQPYAKYLPTWLYPPFLPLQYQHLTDNANHLPRPPECIQKDAPTPLNGVSSSSVSSGYFYDGSQ